MPESSLKDSSGRAATIDVRDVFRVGGVFIPARPRQNLLNGRRLKPVDPRVRPRQFDADANITSSSNKRPLKPLRCPISSRVPDPLPGRGCRTQRMPQHNPGEQILKLPTMRSGVSHRRVPPGNADRSLTDSPRSNSSLLSRLAREPVQ